MRYAERSESKLPPEQGIGLRSRLRGLPKEASRTQPQSAQSAIDAEGAIGAQVLSESIARETAYLDGLADAISVIEQSASAGAGTEASEPVLKAVMKERRGCFAAGIGGGMILAGLGIAAGLAGFIPLAYVQIGLLAAGVLAVLFARDPFKLDPAANARETAAWRRLVELRLKALGENVQARSEIVDQLTASAGGDAKGDKVR